MQTVKTINAVLMGLFFLCYSYQFFYVVVSLLFPFREKKEELAHRIAILIAARNEAAVIGKLLESIRAQTYPESYIGVFVAADNCTDNTAAVARSLGATVFERHDREKTGKGYALRFLLESIGEHRLRRYDAFLVLDADNILEPDYIREMNRALDGGHEILTSYRNSKNYGDNWISAGYGLWFLRESRYLNGARATLGTSCAVSGTGFLFTRNILEKCGGWQYFLLTEDIEFSIDNILRGENIGYVPNAILYDEQPTSFSQSWRQRIRWSRGYMQVFRRYGKRLIRGIFHGSFSCYDMTMNILPAAILSGVSILVNVGAAVWGFASGGSVGELGFSVLETLVSVYLTLFVLGGITTVTEWENIHTAPWKKVLYSFTFPLFMLTYIPVCAASFFGKVEWKPIRHDRAMSIREMTGKK